MQITGTRPTGESLMRTLVDLLADQEGLKIKYTIEKGESDETQNKRKAE